MGGESCFSVVQYVIYSSKITQQAPEHMLVYFWMAELRRHLFCLESCVSRLNVIFSKFDEVQRSGNMVLSPMSGKITFPVIFVFVFLLPKLGCGSHGNMVLLLVWHANINM